MFETIAKWTDKRSVIGALVVGVSLASAPAAVALPQFTWNPAAVGLNGTSFIADNIIVSDFSTVVLTPFAGGANFTDVGTLAVSAFQNGASPVTVNGLNATGGFGLYFNFTATGFQSTPTFTGATTGVFNTLNFSLFGYNVTGPVSYLPSNVTPTGVVAPITLATGTLIAGGVGATTIPGFAAVPNANTVLNFTPTLAGSAFFVNPNPFYNAAFAAFTNNPSQVAFTPGGFVITNGGGSVNFFQVPEPASLTLLGAGLVGVGLMRSKRRRGAA